MNTADVVVVGAGPAGSMAALTLARAGVRVQLLDRARFPRPKLCGDTLNPGAFAILQRCDTAGGSDLAAQIRAHAVPLTGMRLSGPRGAGVTADYPHGLRGWSIPRAQFDQLLIEQAAAAGVDVVEGRRVVAPTMDAARVTGVTVQRRATEAWRARVVIVADGRGSRLAGALGLSTFARRPRRWAFGAYFSGVRDVGPRGEMHLRRDGYIGLSPLRNGLTNVCVVRHARAGETTHIDQRTIIAQTIGRDDRLRDRFLCARQSTPVMVLGPLAIEVSAVGCPGALAAGDAAGFIDPVTGDGLRFALRGGELAARAALAELETGRPAYRELALDRRRAFSHKWRLNRLLRTLVGSPSLLDAAAQLSGYWPWPARALIGIAGDVSEATADGVEGTTTPVAEHSEVW